MVECTVSVRGRKTRSGYLVNGRASGKRARVAVNNVWESVETRLALSGRLIIAVCLYSDRKNGRIPNLSERKNQTILEAEADFVRCLAAVSEHEVAHVLMRPEAPWRSHHWAMERAGIVVRLCQ